jgi:cob(I)alamin adenosyltransferase
MAEAAWAQARALLQDETVDLVLLDELNIALKKEFLDLPTVLEDLANRPPMQHVVITGRGAPQDLIDIADTVTDMRKEKHAFEAGVKAQQGVEL